MDKCLPLIEWTLVCIPITILSLKKLWFTSLSLFTITNNEIVSLHTCGTNSYDEYSGSLQFCLVLVTVTSIISLAIILLFENDAINVMTNYNKSNTHHNNKRGLGLVIGSHLVPLCYIAIYLFAFNRNRDSCTTIEEDHSPSYDSTSKGLDHLQFASLGGLSFALSILWMKLSQYNHSKCNINRYGNSDNGSAVKNGQVKETKLYQATTMNSMCWKIYTVLLIVVCCTRCVLSSSGCDDNTLLFGLIHVMLIMLYDQQIPQTKCKEQTTPQAYWQDAFTFGEWNAIATFITSLVGEYIVEYIYNSKEGVTSTFTRLPLPTHIVVAHAGLVGCLVGVALCSFIKKLVLSNNVQQNNFITIRTIGMFASLVIIVGVTVVCLEVALKSSVSEDAFCGIGSTTCTANNITINWVLLPLSVQWILHFLSSGKDIPSFSGSNTIPSRVLILGYWIALLAICLPLSSLLMSWITSNGTGLNKTANEITVSEDIDNHIIKYRKKRVIIARKYFHVVAILLFTPITYLDPDMMSLSYAIAISFLIVLEMIRGWIDNIVDRTHWNTVYTTFLDEKDSRGGLVVSHIALILGCAIPLWITQLLSRANDVFESDDNNMLFTLLPYLGITVLGVGDSAAAIGGIRFGRHNWPGESSRTLEGSCCMFLSMMVVVLTMGTFMGSTNIISSTTATMGVITLLEASTIQIDNFVLPLAGVTLVCCILTR